MQSRASLRTHWITVDVGAVFSHLLSTALLADPSGANMHLPSRTLHARMMPENYSFNHIVSYSDNFKSDKRALILRKTNIFSFVYNSLGFTVLEKPIIFVDGIAELNYKVNFYITVPTNLIKYIIHLFHQQL